MEDLHNRWSHRWLHPNAECRESPIHGLGVFAKRSINKGEIVAILGGLIVPKEEIQGYWDILGHVGIQINEDFFIVPSSREELKKKGVFNHSCNPNIGFVDDIRFVAIRDIEPEEEICFDYAFNETIDEGFECNCGSKNCRKVVKPSDWKNPEIRKRYREFFSPYLRRKL